MMQSKNVETKFNIYEPGERPDIEGAIGRHEPVAMAAHQGQTIHVSWNSAGELIARLPDGRLVTLDMRAFATVAMTIHRQTNLWIGRG
jgi:uncharacterized protein YaeQ